MALPCSGAASAPLPVLVPVVPGRPAPGMDRLSEGDTVEVFSQSVGGWQPAVVVERNGDHVALRYGADGDRSRIVDLTASDLSSYFRIRPPQLLLQPIARGVAQTAPVVRSPQLLQPANASARPQAAPPSPVRRTLLAADGSEARWDGLLRGVSRTEDAFGKRRRLSRIDPIEIRAAIWQNRGVLMSGIRQPDVALEATTSSASVGTARLSDPELLRGMLCEILLWCAPSETPAAILHSVVLQRSPGDEGVDSALAELELGDFVTVAVSATPHPGWTAVQTPLNIDVCLCLCLCLCRCRCRCRCLYVTYVLAGAGRSAVLWA